MPGDGARQLGGVVLVDVDGKVVLVDVDGEVVLVDVDGEAKDTGGVMSR